MKNQMSDKACNGRLRRLPLRSRMLRFGFILARKLLFNVRVTGRENISAHNVIVVANHLSWIDFLLIWTILPAEPRLYILGASQADNSRFKHWLRITFGGIMVFERGANWVGKDALLQPVRTLESGASLLLFPEGDVGSKEGALMRLTRGVGHFALLAPDDCPILPIALSGVQELYWRKEIRVIVGEPFRVRAQGLDYRTAIDAAVNQIEAALRRLLPAYVEPVVAHKRLHFLTTLSDHL